MGSFKVFKGTLAGGVVYESERVATQSRLRRLIITNKAAGVATVQLKLSNKQGNETYIAPVNLQIATGASYTDADLLLISMDTIIVESDVEVDYYLATEEVR